MATAPHPSSPAASGWGLPDTNSGASGFYKGLRATVKLAMRAFYRTVEVTGREHLDTSRPTILASNHPNSIVDPLIVGLFEERPVAFCARDGLFKVPVFGRLLREVGAIPISRRSDHGGKKVDNADAFAACREVLDQRGVISIFPEGKTHDALKIQALKTGTARIALDAEQTSGLGVQIVPVGLNYLVRQAFRSDVHVAFGEPINVAEFTAAADSDPRAAAKALTERIGDALRGLAIHVEEAEDERVIAQVTSIVVDIRAESGLDGAGQTPAERTGLVRRIVDAYRWATIEDPDTTADLRRRLQHYLDERVALGLGGGSAALQHRTERNRQRAEPWDVRRRRLLRGAPFAAYGFANSALPYWALRTILKAAAPRKDRQALTKLLVGTAVYGGIWGAQTSAVSLFTGPIGGAVYGATVPLSALYALRYMTEAKLHRLTLSGLRAFWKQGDRLEALRRERDALKADVAALRDAYLAHLGETP